MNWLYTGLVGVAGLGVGAFVSEAAKQAAGSVSSRIGGRRRSARAMNAVVMDVLNMWKGFSYEYDDLQVVGMDVQVTLTNHSDQLVKNVRVRMRHLDDDDVDTAKWVPAIGAGSTEQFTISRELGLDDDRPYVEEEPGWQIYYSFEADFDDTDGHGWRLTLDPLTWTQRVTPRRARRASS
jgi:hypothetical protein